MPGGKKCYISLLADLRLVLFHVQRQHTRTWCFFPFTNWP